MTNPFIAIQPAAQMPYLGMMLLQEGACPYLSDGRSTLTAIGAPSSLTLREFDETLEVGMRRSGILVYRPVCQGCRKCFPMRIKVSDFVLTPSQHRVLKRCNEHFVAEIADASLTDEKVDLYQRYQAIKHHERLSFDLAREAYQRFLVETCTQTKEMRWRTKEGKLVGVGILDMTKTSLSSVYFFWDPDFAEFSLGTFSMIKEIYFARELGLEYYYLGYFVPGSLSMHYKINFGPAEIWNGSAWERLHSRNPQDPETYAQLEKMEEGNFEGDAERFDLTKSFYLDSSIERP